MVPAHAGSFDCVRLAPHLAQDDKRLCREITPAGRGQECPRHTAYSNTLSSSFFLPQSAAAWTKATTRGCGFFAVELS